jgi:hypothetical protein
MFFIFLAYFCKGPCVLIQALSLFNPPIKRPKRGLAGIPKVETPAIII